MIPAFAAYLFDVDGTLVDSAPDICGAIQGVLVDTPANNLSDEFLRRYIGRHLLDTFQDVLPDYSADQCAELMVEYRKVYLGRNHAATKVYPGVIEALSSLRGKKSTATTKGTPTTSAVLEQFGLLRFFDHVQGTDGFPAKPDPAVILKAIEALGVEAKDCLMVGDSTSDMEAAKAAGVRVAAVTYGYGTKEELTRWRPDYWVADLRDLLPHS